MSAAQTYPYDAYLFDWDGTLARTVEVWLAEIKRTCEVYEVKASAEDIAKHFGDWQSPIYFGLDPDKLDEFNDKLVAAVHSKLVEAPLYEGAFAMLKRLKGAGKQLALITSSRRESVEILIHHHGVADMFGVVITVDDVTSHKPDPEGLHAAMKLLGADAAATVMVGDTDKDLGAAQRAGIDSILFHPKTHEGVFDLNYLQTFKPKKVIRKWSDF